MTAKKHRRARRKPSNQGVDADQRFTAENPCPICGGYKQAAPGAGIRCWGYTFEDGTAAVCTREESDTELESGNGWVHRLDGEVGVKVKKRSPSQPTKDDASETRYIYRDETGDALYTVVRGSNKSFRQERANGKRSLDGVRRVPYRLPELIEAVRHNEAIYIVEGEKDVETLVGLGVTATCNSEGAGNWRSEFADHFTGASVVVVADDDEPGMAHARQVRSSLLGRADSVEVVRAASGKDATDHIEAGHSLNEFIPVPARFSPTDLAGHEVEEIEWLFDDVLLAGGYHLIFSKPGTGKTMFSLCLAHQLVRQEKLVVYLDQENGPDVVKSRALAIGFTEEDLRRLVYFPFPTAAAGELGEMVGEVLIHRPALVIVDAKANFLAAADLEEDSAMDVTVWHQNVVQHLQRAGSAVLELDHTGHSNTGRARGSIGKSAVAEAEWSLAVSRPFDLTKTAILTLTRGAKNRRGVLPPEVKFKVGGDGAGGFVFKRVGNPIERKKQAREERLRSDIVKVVADHFDATGEPISQSEIEQLVQGTADKIRKAARSLSDGDDAQLTVTEGERNALLYAPKDADHDPE